MTPSGVAECASAPLLHLLWAQGLFAGLFGIAAGWFVQTAYVPVIQEAIAQLPEQGEIRGGQLRWPEEPTRLLAARSQLALSVDLDHAGQTRAGADLQVEFGRTDIRVSSLIGYVELPYPGNYVVAANAPEVGSWWHAWQPVVVIGAGVFLSLLLIGAWGLLGLLYSVPVRWLARIGRREIDLSGAWKLSVWTMLPGSLLLTLAWVLYGRAIINPPHVLFLVGAAFLLGWIYLLLAICLLPAQPSGKRKRRNPFAGDRVGT